jgi:hypothetical protein
MSISFRDLAGETSEREWGIRRSLGAESSDSDVPILEMLGMFAAEKRYGDLNYE